MKEEEDEEEEEEGGGAVLSVSPGLRLWNKKRVEVHRVLLAGH